MSQDIDLGEFVCGEIPSPLEYQFLDANNQPMDLTAYTAVFEWAEFDSGATQRAAAVTAPDQGKVTYTWTGAEFVTPGSYAAIFWAGNGVQRYASWRIHWTARASVGPVPSI